MSNIRRQKFVNYDILWFYAVIFAFYWMCSFDGIQRWVQLPKRWSLSVFPTHCSLNYKIISIQRYTMLHNNVTPAFSLLSSILCFCSGDKAGDMDGTCCGDPGGSGYIVYIYQWYWLFSNRTGDIDRKSKTISLITISVSQVQAKHWKIRTLDYIFTLSTSQSVRILYGV